VGRPGPLDDDRAVAADVVPVAAAGRARRPTATAAFGSGRREAHDASAFYDRFVAPEISADTDVAAPAAFDVIHRHDARAMTAVPTGSVALVVTSPPYFAGKQYELSLGVGGVPANYFEYLELLRDVFAECKRVLEPGGRIAVNVANLGRRPYRSLSGDVTTILQDLGLLLRGEVVWWKGRAAGGSCAWGTFQRPANPVLRDVTERVVIASKGRFDRALTPAQRSARDLPATATITRDEFIEATTDLWEIAPESATRVGHPAPFPVELPQRLIELYTYAGDVVLDPFMGSGSTAVAAVRTGRHYVGFDTDGDYIATAHARIAAERSRVAMVPPAAGPDDDAITQAVRAGAQAKELARLVVEQCGFTAVRRDVKPRGLGITLDLVATDRTGQDWAFDTSGSFTSSRNGLRRTDTLWRALGKAAVLHSSPSALPLVLVTTDAPTRGTPGHQALTAVRGPGRPVTDVVELLSADDRARLTTLAATGPG
jgi:DNA modification methylase